MIRSRGVLVAGVAVVGILGLAACSSSGSSKSSDTKSSDTSSTTAAPAGSSTSTASAAVVVKVGNTKLGKVLTDDQGKTLYLYKKDQGTKSVVPAGLLAAWPPVMATAGGSVGAGLVPAKLVAVTQPNGQRWFTYNGHVLYTFSGDTAPGDANGQDLGDVWYAMSDAGAPIGS